MRRDGLWLVAALAIAAAVDWEWQLPAAALPALIAVGVGRRQSPAIRGVAVAVAALAVGVAVGLHGLGAALLESGRPAAARLLLPGDARPDAALQTRAAYARGCRLEIVANQGQYPLLGVGLLLDRDLHIDYRAKTVTIA